MHFDENQIFMSRWILPPSQTPPSGCHGISWTMAHKMVAPKISEVDHWSVAKVSNDRLIQTR
jgi:hypothetical protein